MCSFFGIQRETVQSGIMTNRKKIDHLCKPTIKNQIVKSNLKSVFFKMIFNQTFDSTVFLVRQENNSFEVLNIVEFVSVLCLYLM
jgi:hypothetical protein